MLEGTSMVESAICMEYEEYKYILTNLFIHGKYEEAAFCGLDQAMAGRISEAANVLWSSFKVHPTLFHLQSKWYRGKTKIICDDVNIFPSLESAEYCSIHTLAALAAMRPHFDQKVFVNLGAQPSVSSKSNFSVSQKMNDILRAMKSAYDEDSNYFNKTVIFRAGLTTHSIRHMCVNMLHRNIHIKDEWREARAQHANKENKSQIKSTKNAYIKFDYCTDAPCGKCLANHKNVLHESKCPYMNILPIPDQAVFHMLTLELLTSISFVDISVRYLFSCILITWFNDNIKKYGDESSLVTRIKNIADRISGCNIAEWSSLFKNYLHEQNYVQMPITALTKGESGAVVLDTLSATSAALKILQYDMSQLKNFQLEQAAMNHCLATKVDQSKEEVLSEIKNLANAYTLSHQNKRRRTVQTSISSFYNNHNNITNDIALLDESNDLPNSNDNKPSAFKLEDLKSAMFQWYTKQLFKLPSTDLTFDEKSQLHKCSKIITYMKMFIPPDCTLFTKAMSAADPSYNQWLDDLRILCNQTQELVMAFVDRQYFQKGGSYLSGNRKQKARFDATFKLLESIPKNEFPTIINVVRDEIFTPATSLHPCYANIVQWEKRNKK